MSSQLAGPASAPAEAKEEVTEEELDSHELLALAERVYHLLKEELRIERERLGWRSR